MNFVDPTGHWFYSVEQQNQFYQNWLANCDSYVPSDVAQKLKFGSLDNGTIASDTHEEKWNDEKQVIIGDELYLTSEYQWRTNCYAYAFDLLINPITGKKFFAHPQLGGSNPCWAMQPGMFVGKWLIGEYDGKKLVDYVKEDAEEIGYNFYEYEYGTKVPDGNWLVALVYEKGGGNDYHWYRRSTDGTWSHKPRASNYRNIDNSGKTIYDTRLCDWVRYTNFVGYFIVGPNQKER
ncbi:MAG: hypothetical protein WDA65_00895 [Christensenellales bacterium]